MLAESATLKESPLLVVHIVIADYSPERGHVRLAATQESESTRAKLWGASLERAALK